MKKIAFFLALSLWLAACGSNTPKGVAGKFLSCLQARDFEKAKEYATPETAVVIDMIKSFPDTEAPVGFKILRDTIYGDGEALVEYSVRKKDGSESRDKVKLVKIDGKWKINMSIKKK